MTPLDACEQDQEAESWTGGQMGCSHCVLSTEGTSHGDQG